MPGYFEFDDGNGNYDVPTYDDYERWEDERRDWEQERQDRWEQATEEERQDGSWDCPY